MWTLNPPQAMPPVLNDKRREEKRANAHIHLLPKPPVLKMIKEGRRSAPMHTYISSQSPQYSMVKQGRRGAPMHTYISSQSQAPSTQGSMVRKAFSKETGKRKDIP